MASSDSAKASRRWLPFRSLFFFLAAILFLVTSPRVSSGENPDSYQGESEGRVGCPHCENDGSEVSRLLQRADELYADFESAQALGELLKVIQIDPHNPEALSKIARVYIDFGDMIPESGPDWRERRTKHYLTAEEYARKAVRAHPNGTWGHFYVAAALGKIALQSSLRKQIDLSREIRAAVERAIALDPQNGFAYHIYGIWHRRLAEIGQMSRLAASLFLWRTVPQGSMEKSLEYLRKAISLNPTVIAHRLELAKSYMAMGKWGLARNALRKAQELPIQFSDDALNKSEARRLFQEIKDR